MDLNPPCIHCGHRMCIDVKIVIELPEDLYTRRVCIYLRQNVYHTLVGNHISVYVNNMCSLIIGYFLCFWSVHPLQLKACLLGPPEQRHSYTRIL